MKDGLCTQSVGRKSTIVLTGAGISKAAGIPTFEEIPRLREYLTVDCFNNNYEEFWQEIKLIKKIVEGKEPTVAHNLLASKKDWQIVTMNIDSLHKKAGTSKLTEVHGNLETVTCTKCHKVYPFKNAGIELYCPKCGGKIKPNIALYGENVEVYKTVMKQLQIYTDVIIIGTSFMTGFASEFRDAANELGKNIRLFNTNANEELTEFMLEQELF